MATRDSLTHRGRSLLILVMIGAPVLLMVAALTLNATKNISPSEGLNARLGRAVAAVSGPSDQQTPQNPYGEGSFRCPETGHCAPPPAVPLPGTSRDEAGRSGPGVAKAIASLTGARLVPYGESSGSASWGTTRRNVNTVLIDGRDRVAPGKADLLSGRWPAKANEIVVTATAVASGFPEQGTVTVSQLPDSGSADGPRPTTYTIVGVGRATLGPLPAHLIRLPQPDPNVAWATYLLDRAAPVTWAEVRKLNTYGLTVVSREAVTNPPPADQLDANVTAGGPDGFELAVVALLAAGLVVESVLLAGPAFAVIAQRQRHTLAMAAVNGASAAQLRRVVLAQALVLGVCGALVAGLAGIGLALGFIAVYVRWWSPESVFGPLDVPLAPVAIVVGTAVVAAVVAALLPARGMNRLDVVSVLRGQVPLRGTRRSVPALGLALAVGGGIAVFTGTRLALGESNSPVGPVLLVLGSVSVVVGALMTVPIIVQTVGRLAASLPVPIRIAARGNARQRGGATSTVAAIMAGAVLLSTISIVIASLTERDRRQYRPSGPDGWLVAQASPSQHETLPQAVRAALPGARPMWVYQFELPAPAGAAADESRWRTILGTPPSCVPVPGAVIARTGPDHQLLPARPECPVTGQGWPGPASGSLIGMSADDARTLYGLDEDNREFLKDGGILTADARLASAQRLTFTTAELPEQSNVMRWQPVGAGVTLPTRLATRQLDRFSVAPSTPVSLATPETLRRIGGVAEPDRVVAAGIDGPVTEDQRLAVVRAMSGRGMPDDLVDQSITVERGFRSDYATLLLLLQGTVCALILVATVTATALSLGESRRDLATLAAVGGTTQTRQAVAAAQAAGLALIGTLLGVLVGAVPGIAVGRAITLGDPQQAADVANVGSTLTIPWPTFAVAVIGVPLLAAAIASLLARRAPTMTRRTA